MAVARFTGSSLFLVTLGCASLHPQALCFRHASRALQMTATTSDFFGTDRFRIRRRLGSGGMGVVYEAHDRETDKVLALKALTRTEAGDIYRFKREFRALADVS